jgi:GNAT superfamily N-acetyltransferase
MNIKIREIIEADYPNVVSLWNDELGCRNINIESFTTKMAMMSKDENYKTFVALIDSTVVGFITIVQTLAIEFEIGYLKVNGLAVQKNHQNKGIGTTLIQYAEEYAKEKGLSCLILNSGFQRKDAHAFYERKGYQKTSYCFVKRI